MQVRERLTNVFNNVANRLEKEPWKIWAFMISVAGLILTYALLCAFGLLWLGKWGGGWLELAIISTIAATFSLTINGKEYCFIKDSGTRDAISETLFGIGFISFWVFL